MTEMVTFKVIQITNYNHLKEQEQPLKKKPSKEGGNVQTLNHTFAITDIRIASAKADPQKKKPQEHMETIPKFSPKDRLNQSLASAVKPEDFYRKKKQTTYQMRIRN